MRNISESGKATVKAFGRFKDKVKARVSLTAGKVGVARCCSKAVPLPLTSQFQGFALTIVMVRAITKAHRAKRQSGTSQAREFRNI